MKQIKYLFYSLLAVIGFVSCETYGDYDVEYTAIHPMGGMYRITVVDEAGTTLDLAAQNLVYIANTADNSTTQCWIRIGNYNLAATNAYSINGKINCQLNALTFSGSNIENLAGNVTSSTETFTVTDGKIVLDGATPPSGGKSDAISFTFTNSRFPGKTYSVTGYRYTGWEGD